MQYDGYSEARLLKWVAGVSLAVGIVLGLGLSAFAYTPNWGPNIQTPQPPINSPVQNIHPR